MVDFAADLLHEQARLIEQKHGVSVQPVVLDLRHDDFLDQLTPITDPLVVGLLVNNAGISTITPFLETDRERLLDQIQTNVRAPLILTYHFGKLMVAQGRGGIIMLSSASAVMGTAFVANYAATKAYNHILGESLWYEMQQSGVDVLSLLVGATRTPGWEHSNPKITPPGKVLSSDEVVQEAFHALGRYPSRITGRSNRLSYGLMNLLSRSFAIRIVSRVMKRSYS
jgi:short-subunit dehydrogenase